MINSISLSNVANYTNNLQVMSKLFHRKLALAVSSQAAKICSARSTNTSWGSSPPLRTRGKGRFVRLPMWSRRWSSLAPHKGRVYDPCCGSDGIFVQSEGFVEAHGGKHDDISIYGQESNPIIWGLATMNLAIRGRSADLGQEPADTSGRDQHPDQKFDFIPANPPFNISDWDGEKYNSDPRWVHGRPPVGNANDAWLQHMLWKLRPGGEAGVVLANGSMSSNTSDEGQIREAMVRGDVVEAMGALPGQLFLNTQIPVCLWFLTNDKTQRGRDHRGEILFVDALQMGTIETRVNRVPADEDIVKIDGIVQVWRGNSETEHTYGYLEKLPLPSYRRRSLDFLNAPYEDVSDFCYSTKFEEIEKNNFILTSGYYVGTVDQEEHDEPFDQKMKCLTTLLTQQQAGGARLDGLIAASLRAPRKITFPSSEPPCWSTRSLAATTVSMATSHPRGQACLIFRGILEEIGI